MAAPSLLLLVARIAGVVRVVVRSGRSRQGVPRATPESLDERYARGDITTEEHRDRLDALR